MAILEKYRPLMEQAKREYDERMKEDMKNIQPLTPNKIDPSYIDFNDTSTLKKMADGGSMGNPPTYSQWLLSNPDGTTDDYELYKRGLNRSNGTGSISGTGLDSLLKYIDKGLMSNTTGLQSNSYKPGTANNYPDGYFTEDMFDESNNNTETIPPDINGNIRSTGTTDYPLLQSTQGYTSPGGLKEYPIEKPGEMKMESPDNQNQLDYGYIAQEAGRLSPAMLQDIKEGYAGAINATRNAVGGNAGTYLANLSSLQAGKSKSEYQARVGKYNADNEANMRAQLGNAELAKYNSGMSFQVDDWNMRSSEMAKNLMREGFANVGQYTDAKANEAFMYEYIKATSPTYYDQVKKRGIRKPSPTQGS
jgi:hypothetical protein